MNHEFKIELLTEDADYGYRLSGPFCASDRLNRNFRIYEKEDLKKEVQKLKEKLEKGEDLYLYKEHPDHLDMIREDACAIFESIDWDDDEGIGYCVVKTLKDTKDGKKVNQDISNGIGYGISTRGLGSVNEKTKVVENYEMITADLIKNTVHSTNGKQLENQSCQICTMKTLKESVNSEEKEINTLQDFLIESKDCGCVMKKLDETDKKIVQNKIIESFCELWKNK